MWEEKMFLVYVGDSYDRFYLTFVRYLRKRVKKSEKKKKNNYYYFVVLEIKLMFLWK